jgi:[acyl-carrier-protein] S-malonyltransferase
MQESAENNPGKMASIIGLDEDTVGEICEEVKDGIVVIANLNSPTQIVISGEANAVEEAVSIAQEKGASRALFLSVSGAFHSPLMKQAQTKLAEQINKLTINSPEIPVVFNTTGEPVFELSQIKNAMIDQVTSPVKWVDVMETMSREFYLETFLEIGCGAVLRGLARKINPEMKVLSINNAKSIEVKVKELL